MGQTVFNFHNAQIFLIGGKLAKANVFSKAKNCKSISIHYVKYPSLCSWFNSIKLPYIACLPLHQIRAIFKLIVPKFHRFFFLQVSISRAWAFHFGKKIAISGLALGKISQSQFFIYKTFISSLFHIQPIFIFMSFAEINTILIYIFIVFWEFSLMKLGKTCTLPLGMGQNTSPL